MPSPVTPPVPAAEAAALRLAAEAGALDLAAAAASPAEGAGTLATLLAHELATGHRLMMRLAARAEDFLDHAAAEAQSPDERRAGLEAARLAGAAGRLMERYRLGLLALHKLREPGPEDKSERRIRLAWANCPFHDHPNDGSSESAEASPDNAPAAPDGNGPPEDGPGPDGPGGGLPSAAPPSPRPASPPSGAAPARGPRAGIPLGRRRGRLRNGNPSGDYAAAPRCGAKTRAGRGCRQPAMANGRCRLHGGKSTGPRTAAGLRRCRTARLRHGARSVPLAALRRAAARSARRLRLLTAVGQGAGRVMGRRSPAGHGVHRPEFAPRRMFSDRPHFSVCKREQNGYILPDCTALLAME